MKGFVGKVLMVVENQYPLDRRVANEAEKLTGNGYQVTVIAIRGKGEKSTELVRGVRTYRIPRLELFDKTAPRNGNFLARFTGLTRSSLGYSLEYSYISFASFVLSFWVLFREGFDIIHVHNPPDTYFIMGAFYKLFGKKYIFDHHDLSPELYQSRFGRNKDLLFWMLRWFEKLNFLLADLIIATNESYKAIEIKRGKISPEKIFIVRNGPNLNKIRKVVRPRESWAEGKTLLAYVGVIGPQDGLDYLVRALKELREELGRNDFVCVVVGFGDALEDVKILSQDLGMSDIIRFTGFIPDEDMLAYLTQADICLDPNPSNPLNDSSTWIKVMEYMALEKPLVSFDLKETRFTAGEAAIYAPPNDIRKFAEAVNFLIDHPEKGRDMGKWGKNRVENDLKWDKVSEELLRAYQSLSAI